MENESLEGLDFIEGLGERQAHERDEQDHAEGEHLPVAEKPRRLPRIDLLPQRLGRNFMPDSDERFEKRAIRTDPAAEEDAAPDDERHRDADPEHEDEGLGEKDLRGELESCDRAEKRQDLRRAGLGLVCEAEHGRRLVIHRCDFFESKPFNSPPTLIHSKFCSLFYLFQSRVRICS